MPETSPERGRAERAVKSAGRVFAVLELFERERRALNVKEISASLALPQSSTSVLLADMARHGYLEQEESTRRYLPTVRVALLGQWLSEYFFVDQRLTNMMRHLSAQTGETVLFGVFQDWAVVYAHVIQATNPMRLYVPPGTRRPLHNSGAGLSLLAGMTDEQIAAGFDRIRAVPERAPDLRLPDLLARVDEVRTRGFAVSADAVTQGAGVVALRLAQTVGGRPVVLGVGGSSAVIRQNWQSLLEALRSAITLYDDPPSFRS
ncbi:IclR family transcriptional regulator [Enterovirga sp. CN4-39]|uniref:IclR family transcriptional regulator n=1 Tax=Enterovirga sp. CN4-39 TaxID=3400910 RepID=UPI003C0C31B7